MVAQSNDSDHYLTHFMWNSMMFHLFEMADHGFKVNETIVRILQRYLTIQYYHKHSKENLLFIF